MLGAHGALADFAFPLIEQLALINGCGSVRVDRFDVIDFSANPKQIVLCNYPSNQIVAAIARDDLKVLLLLENATDTQKFMERALGIEPLEAIRSQSASAIANLALGRSSNVTFFERANDCSILQLIFNVLEGFDLTVAPDQCRALAEACSEGLGADADIAGVLAKKSEAWSFQPQHSADPNTGRSWSDVCRDVIDSTLAMARFGSARPIVWPTEVFSVASPPSVHGTSNVALPGKSRNIFFGPYFYLPPSSYRVEIFINFSDDVSSVPFSLEVHAGAWLSRATIDRWRPGLFRGAFDLAHTDATSTVEIRLRNLAEISRGTLSLVEVLFYPERQRST